MYLFIYLYIYIYTYIYIYIKICIYIYIYTFVLHCCYMFNIFFEQARKAKLFHRTFFFGLGSHTRPIWGQHDVQYLSPCSLYPVYCAYVTAVAMYIYIYIYMCVRLMYTNTCIYIYVFIYSVITYTVANVYKHGSSIWLE